MKELSVQINVENFPPNAIIVHVEGRLYMGTLSILEEHLEALFLKSAGKKIVVDLAEATYVSSNCWSLFLIAARRIKKAGGLLLLSGMKDEVLNAYELLELQLFIQHFPDVSSALALSSLKRAPKVRA